MPEFAAVRITDPYACKMHPGSGGTVVPGPPNPQQNVLIENLPAAKTLDITTCPGPPQLDVLNHGCRTVLINDQLAVRTLQDLTLHQNNFLKGAARTFIGLVGDSVEVDVPTSMIRSTAKPVEQEKETKGDGDADDQSELKAPPTKSTNVICPSVMVLRCKHSGGRDGGNRNDNGNALEVKGGDVISIEVEPGADGVKYSTTGEGGIVSGSSVQTNEWNTLDLTPYRFLMGTLQPKTLEVFASKADCSALQRQIFVFPGDSYSFSANLDVLWLKILDHIADLANFIEEWVGRRFLKGARNGLEIPLPGGKVEIPVPQLSARFTGNFEENTYQTHGDGWWMVSRRVKFDLSLGISITLALELRWLLTIFPPARAAYTGMLTAAGIEDPVQGFAKFGLGGDAIQISGSIPSRGSPVGLDVSGEPFELKFTVGVRITLKASKVLSVKASLTGEASASLKVNSYMKASFNGYLGPIQASCSIHLRAKGWLTILPDSWERGLEFSYEKKIEIKAREKLGGVEVDISGWFDSCENSPE